MLFRSADEDIYHAVLSAVASRPDPVAEGALNLSELPRDRRLEILLDQFTGLTAPAPTAVGVWANLSRRLLTELPESERQRFAEPFAMATSHILELT